MSIQPKAPVARTSIYEIELSTANDNGEKANHRLDRAVEEDWHLPLGDEPEVRLVWIEKHVPVATAEDKQLADRFRALRTWVDENEKHDEATPPTWAALAERLK